MADCETLANITPKLVSLVYSSDMSNFPDGPKSASHLDRPSRQLELELRQQEQDGRPSSSVVSCNEDRTHSELRVPLTFINTSDPKVARNRNKVRTARSHAITVALARKRFEEQKRGSHFRLQKVPTRNLQSEAKHSRDHDATVAPGLLRPFGTPSIDPFETLSVDAQRLTALLHLRSSLRAGEPVFVVNDAIHDQSLQSIFETGLTDGALTAAIGLTLSYAASGWRTTAECVEFSCIATHQLRRKLIDPLNASPSATIGAILLLLGNAYRTGELQSAQTHLGGLRSLLHSCRQHDIRLPSTLKRAIYWQDLFSSMFLGTDRVVSYEEVYPDQDLVIKHTRQNTCLPIGFARSAHLLGSDVIAAAKDVAALYADRQQWIASNHLAEGLRGLDNIQARMEGHLHALRQSTTDSLRLCCITALQLCVYGFWDGVWNAALIPRELSTKLLQSLRCCYQHDFGEDDLFLWLIYVGKAFAIDAPIRHGLDDLWLGQRCNEGVPTFPPWDEVRCTLSRFVWSDVLFSDAGGWFWERIGE